MRARSRRTLLGSISLLLFVGMGCGVIGFVENSAPLAGPAYWAAVTALPVPTVTVLLGTTTPVYEDPPEPSETAAPGVTVTLEPPVTTTPGLPVIGYTTPVPTETPYYRIGTFYMHSDVYMGDPNGVVFRLTGHETQPSPRDGKAAYHFVTVEVTNHSYDTVVIPASDLFFIRRVEQGGNIITGRWIPQNEPLIARNLPSYETQQVNPFQPDEVRHIVLGFVVPNGDVRELGLITDWRRPVEGGLPVWFFLERDPLGPLADAAWPPPPTSVVLGDGGPQNIGGGLGSGDGMWPTTGYISRGFGCHAMYTAVDGTGFGCPEDRPWFHNGVDIANGQGTLVWSPVEATMHYAGPNSSGPDCSGFAGSQSPHEGLGNYQRLGDGSTLHYFGHLSNFLVTGGSVTAGQYVAEMGSTGCSTGPHLHWIVYQNGNLMDPSEWAGPGPNP